MTTRACLLILTLAYAAGWNSDPRPSPLATRASRAASWNPRQPRRAVPEKGPKKERDEKESDGSISTSTRLRNAFLHVVYIVSASEFLTQSSAFLSFLSEVIGGAQNRRSGGIMNVHTLIPIAIIVLLNIIVWLLWERCNAGDLTTTIDRMEWFFDNFTCDYDPNSKSRAERPHTVLTNAFSHMERSHLWDNMIPLSAFAPWALYCLGSHRLFFYFYVGSIYFARFFNDALLRWLPEKRRWNRKIGFRGWVSRQLNHLIDHVIKPWSLGASGAVCAVQMFSCLSFCWLSLGSVVVVSTLAMFLLMGDLVPLWHNQRFGTPLGDNTGYGDHVGGYIFGALVWLIILRFGFFSIKRDIMLQRSLPRQIIFSIIMLCMS